MAVAEGTSRTWVRSRRWATKTLGTPLPHIGGSQKRSPSLRLVSRADYAPPHPHIASDSVQNHRVAIRAKKWLAVQSQVPQSTKHSAKASKNQREPAKIQAAWGRQQNAPFEYRAALSASFNT